MVIVFDEQLFTALERAMVIAMMVRMADMRYVIGDMICSLIALPRNLVLNKC